MTLRRAVLALLVLVVLAVAWTAWTAYRVQADLRDADAAAQRLRAGVEAGGDDEAGSREALSDLRVAAARAHARATGFTWGAVTHLPVIGDDATGVRALSVSLDRLAADGIQPLADTVDDLDGVASDGQVDLAAVQELQEPMAQAAEAFADAHAEVADLDSSGYAGVLRTRFDDYVDQVRDLDRGVASAARAVEVLPDVLGADGPRDYLLVVQNNAEVRATGGLPGSWSRVHAEDGRLTIEQQGAGSGFGRLEQPVSPLTDEELAVYSDLFGTFFLDANFTPDFPRAAGLWRDRYERDFPDTPLDGVISIDPVALSYLLRDRPPVAVGAVTLTADNVVEQLLSTAYLEPDPAAQDVFFAAAARAIFEATTQQVGAPVEVVRALSQATREGRFAFESYDAPVADALEGSQVRGALSDDDGEAPHVEIGLVDGTGSKMSYYLRYRARVTSQSCSAAGVQELEGSMSLSQTLTQMQAEQLPDYVTGGGAYGTEPGTQVVSVRIFSPTGGSLGRITIGGTQVEYTSRPLDGRQVANLLVQLTGPDDVVVNWAMASGPGQTGAGSVGVTPSVTAGSKDSAFASSC